MKSSRRTNHRPPLPNGADGRLRAEITRLRQQNRHDKKHGLHANQQLRDELTLAEADFRDFVSTEASTRRDLEASRNRYANLYDFAPVGYAVLDYNGIICDINIAGARLLGHTARLLVGFPFGSLLARPERREWMRHLSLQRRLGAAPGDFQATITRHKGPPLFLRLYTARTVPIEFDNAKLGLLRVAMVDVTAQRRAEDEIKQLTQTLEDRVRQRTMELTEANDRLRAILDRAQIGIIVFNSNGAVESANPAAARIFGYSTPEFPGLKIADLFGWQQSPYQEQDWLAQLSGQPFAGVPQEVSGRRKDGSSTMLEVSLTASTRAGKQELVAMVNDATDRKRLERQLLDVGERERQRLGHELHDSLGQQLHAISFMTALHRDELRKESPARAREAGRIAKHLEHALELTRSLARGLQPVSPLPEGLMQTLKELAQRTREFYHVNCHFECHSPVLVRRHSAASNLYRIAQEAVNNALKHGHPTRIRIQLMATPQNVILSVQDNGRGIRRPLKKHKGIGLHIMQHRADAIPASLLVHRLPDGGTEVVCTIAREALASPDPHK